jgi:hypothetical protein
VPQHAVKKKIKKGQRNESKKQRRKRINTETKINVILLQYLTVESMSTYENTMHRILTEHRICITMGTYPWGRGRPQSLVSNRRPQWEKKTALRHHTDKKRIQRNTSEL